MKKRTSKTYTIDDILYEKFDKITNDNMINKSKLIESCIQNWVSKQEQDENDKTIFTIKDPSFKDKYVNGQIYEIDIKNLDIYIHENIKNYNPFLPLISDNMTESEYEKEIKIKNLSKSRYFKCLGASRIDGSPMFIN